MMFWTGAKSVVAAVIAFFSTPLGQAVGALLLAVVIYSWGHHSGYASCKAEWHAANIQADLRKKEREAEISTQLEELERQKREALAKADEDFRKRLAEYERELAKRPNGSCTLDDDDVRSLQ